MTKYFYLTKLLSTFHSIILYIKYSH